MTQPSQNNPVKIFKRHVNRLALSMISYEFILIIVTFIWLMFSSLGQGLLNNASADAVTAAGIETASSNGWPYIFGALIAMAIAMAFRKRRQLQEDLTHIRLPMRPYVFFIFFALIMAVQLVNRFFVAGMEASLNALGYSMAESMQSLEHIGSSVSMFLYVVIFGPVAEEVVFRGIVLRSLEKYGKVFAIVFSSIGFGLMHGNLYQGLFAFGVGLILAYVACEYSFKWAVVIHVLNNLLFGEAVLFLSNRFGENTIAAVLLALYFVATVFAAIVLIKNKADIRAYLQTNRTEKGVYRAAFSSIFFVVYVVLNLILIRVSITKFIG